MSSFSWPFNSAWNKNSLRNSALIAPSQTASNAPAATNGEAARPDGMKRERFWTTLRSGGPPFADLTDKISPASGLGSAALSVIASDANARRRREDLSHG